MTLSRAIGSTPFQLVYGTEAILPVEVALGFARVDLVDPLGLKLERHFDLDIAK